MSDESDGTLVSISAGKIHLPPLDQLVFRDKFGLLWFISVDVYGQLQTGRYPGGLPGTVSDLANSISPDVLETAIRKVLASALESASTADLEAKSA